MASFISVANYPAWSAIAIHQLCARVLGQQVVFENRCTLVVTQFASTVNANNFVLVERTIWQGFEAERAIQKTVFFLHFCSERFVSAAITGHNVHALIACQKMNCVKRNLC